MKRSTFSGKNWGEKVWFGTNFSLIRARTFCIIAKDGVSVIFVIHNLFLQGPGKNLIFANSHETGVEF